MDDTTNIDETVLTVPQRQKRAIIMRRNKAKIARARKIAQRRMAPEKNLKKRAYKMAREMVRRRVAGKRGAEYEKLGPSEKIAIDRSIEGKQDLIKRIALRLLPRVKQAEQKRLNTFLKGQAMQNQEAPEGNKVNEMFTESFSPKSERSVDEPSNDAVIKKNTKKSKENNEIIQYSRFDEAIKGWKNAQTDIMKMRSQQGKNVKLVSLKKNGAESRMSDATKMFRSESDALEHHNRVRKLNPNRNIRHNLYIDGKHVKTLEEEVHLEEKSKLVKYLENKNAIHEENGWVINSKNSTWSPVSKFEAEKSDTYKKLGVKHARSGKGPYPMHSSWARYHYDSGYRAVKNTERKLKEEQDINEVAGYSYYITHNSIEHGKKLVHKKNKPFATLDDAKDHIDKIAPGHPNRRSLGRIHAVSNSTGRITRVVNYDGFNQGYPDSPGIGDAKHVKDLHEEYTLNKFNYKTNQYEPHSQHKSSKDARLKAREILQGGHGNQIKITNKEGKKITLNKKSYHNEEVKELDESMLRNVQQHYGKSKEQFLSPANTVGGKNTKRIHHNTDHDIEVYHGMTVYKTTPHYVFHNDRLIHATTSRNNAVQHAEKLSRKLDREKKKSGVNESVKKPYVKPHFGDINDSSRQTGWKSSNKHGKVKYWQMFAKKSAVKHAGLTNENLEEDTGFDNIKKKIEQDRAVRSKYSDRYYTTKSGRGGYVTGASHKKDHVTLSVPIGKGVCSKNNNPHETIHVHHSELKETNIDEDIDSKNREVGTGKLVKRYKKDTPGQCKEDINTLFAEEVKSAEKKPVVVPAHTDAFGNTIPAKTVMRKTGRKIIKTGNVHDGEPANEEVKMDAAEREPDKVSLRLDPTTGKSVGVKSRSNRKELLQRSTFASGI